MNEMLGAADRVVWIEPPPPLASLAQALAELLVARRGPPGPLDHPKVVVHGYPSMSATGRPSAPRWIPEPVDWNMLTFFGSNLSSFLSPTS